LSSIDSTDSQLLANLLANRFIARPDVKAEQQKNGAWHPVCTRNADGTVKQYFKFTRADLVNHVQGKKTYGHYLLNQNSDCKLFAFDIDLEKEGFWCPDVTDEQAWDITEDKYTGKVESFNPRDSWQVRSHPARRWMKFQFRTVAHLLTHKINTELGIHTATAYSGSKGIHVYGFTGLMPAADVREAALIVLDSFGSDSWIPSRGDNFFKCSNQDPVTGYPNLSIELFPKQETLENKDLGNLMRLPLGRNLKSSDPTFFVDPSVSIGELKPMDAVQALLGRDGVDSASKAVS
jgi:hypothetical protein